MNWAKGWPDMTSYLLDEWFWAMFEPTWTWHNFTFGGLFMWIGPNNDQIWLPMGYTSDSEQCLSRLELDLISLFGQLCIWIGANNEWPDMTSYGIDEWFWAMSEQTWTWHNFTFGELYMWIGQIMTRYDFLWARWVILSNVLTDLNLT